MSLLFNVLFAWKCSSTHHKMALDSLRHLELPNAQQWHDVFLYHADAYLEGAKAPDKSFKDFRNHVLHVHDNYWGGAVKTAQVWYERSVQALQEQNWSEAVYNLGVLSHYYTDPIMPFHTGQSVSEGNVHRAAEWSITKSYTILRQLLEEQLGGYPDVSVPDGDDWLASMVTQGAEEAHPHYQPMLDHYNVDLGVKNPPAGLDEELRRRLAGLIGYAIVGFARILERAFADAGVAPPKVSLQLSTILATVNIPVRWITKKMADSKERAVVEAMYNELQETGRVIKHLPEDDRVVRAAHAQEVLKISERELDALPQQPTGTKFGQPAEPQPAATTESEAKPRAARSPRFYLEIDMPVEEAPSIGAKTAARLANIGVTTVADLLALQPDDAAPRLNVRHITAKAIRGMAAPSATHAARAGYALS